jgi:hypothetical protein
MKSRATVASCNARSATGPKQRAPGELRGQSLSLPNMFTACALHGIGRFLLGELLFADRASLCHYICHNLASNLGQVHTQVLSTSSARILDACFLTDV